MSAALIQPGKRQALVRCAIYLRITRDDQKTGFGVDRQLTKAEAMAAVLGWDVVLIIDENDTSASRHSRPRPKYQDLLAKIRKGEIDAVIGYDNTRLTRQPREAEDILDLADSYGVRVALVMSGREINFADPTDRHQFRNATANAALEIELNSIRSRNEREQRAMAGRRNGITPFGWRRVPQLDADGRYLGHREELHPTEADEVRAMARKLLAGVSLRAIASDLNDRGVPTRGTAEGWRSTTVGKVLRRPANVGRRLHRGQVLDVVGQWPAILDDQTHARVQALLADPERRTNYRGNEVRWLLTGLITCGRPGCTGTICSKRRTDQSQSYACSACFQSIKQQPLDDYVCALVADRLAHPALTAPSADAQVELDALYAAMDAIKAEQAQAGELVAAKAITLAQLATMNLAWNEELAELNDRASALLPALAAQTELPNGWDGETDVNVRRAVIRRVFAELVLMPGGSVRGRRRPVTPDVVRHVFR